MSLLHTAADLVLHLDRHLAGLLMLYGAWLYPIVFAVIFAETGLVVTPFLPGDSLLFGMGALAAVDTSGTLRVGWVLLVLALAAAAGNSTNYAVGRRLGRAAFSGRYRFIKVEYLVRTERYFERYGGATVLLSRFMPIVRTFAPFVAGIGHMPHGRFQAFNVAGACAWVLLFVLGGFGFGNLPWVKNNFGIVTIAIIMASLVPVAVMAVRARYAPGSRPIANR
jgi:membrane-associated protein